MRPISPDRLPGELAAHFLSVHGGARPLRVAIDAPACFDVLTLASSIRSALEEAGRTCAVVPAMGFLRDASLRFEFGKTDVESFYSGWLDTAALSREVLAPTDHYLPSLRDPVTNRSTRAQPVSLTASAVVIVCGELLLGVGLPFDLSVHVSVSRQARRRQTPDELQWTLPAWDRYEIDVDPEAIADVVIRADDRRHPAVRGLG